MQTKIPHYVRNAGVIERNAVGRGGEAAATNCPMFYAGCHSERSEESVFTTFYCKHNTIFFNTVFVFGCSFPKTFSKITNALLKYSNALL